MKKIITIGIVCIFLLTGLTAASSIQNEVSDFNTVNTGETTFIVVIVYCGFIPQKGIVRAHPLPYNEEVYYRLDLRIFIDENGREFPYHSLGDIPTGDYLLKFTPNKPFVKPCELQVTLVVDGDNYFTMFTSFGLNSAQLSSGYSSQSSATQSAPSATTSTSTPATTTTTTTSTATTS